MTASLGEPRRRRPLALASAGLLVILVGAACTPTDQAQPPPATSTATSTTGPGDAAGSMSDLDVERLDERDPVVVAAVEAAQERPHGNHLRPYAVRGEAPDEIVVVTFGSSTCPAAPRLGRWLESDGQDEPAYLIEIAPQAFGDDLAEEGEPQPCNDDLVATGFRLEIGDVPSEQVAVLFQEMVHLGGVDLPAVAPDGP